MCSCDQSLVALAFLWKRLSKPQFYKDLTRKTAFFDGWSWLKFNNLGQLDANLKFYTIVMKGLKPKVRKFYRLIPTFVEVTGEKLVGGAFFPPTSQRPPLSWTGLSWANFVISKKKQGHVEILIVLWEFSVVAHSCQLHISLEMVVIKLSCYFQLCGVGSKLWKYYNFPIQIF